MYIFIHKHLYIEIYLYTIYSYNVDYLLHHIENSYYKVKSRTPGYLQNPLYATRGQKHSDNNTKKLFFFLTLIVL